MDIKTLQQILDYIRNKKQETQKSLDARFKEYDASFENGDALKSSIAQLAHEIEYLQGKRQAYESLLDHIGNMIIETEANGNV